MILDVMLDENAKMPEKAHSQDAGFDLFAPEKVVVPEKSSAVVNTGVHIAIPTGYVGFIKSKSGLNINFDISSDAGVIDAGFTGSIAVKINNNSTSPMYFAKGYKIAQLVLLPIPEVELRQVDSLEDTERGANGFGSSGK